MSTSAFSVSTRSVSWSDRLLAGVELIKPRISILVLVVVAVSGMVARWGVASVWSVLHAVVGTILVAGSASALNQWWERARDARMERTADRPLPSGRLAPTSVLAFGLVSVASGLVYLLGTVGWVPAAWALATWILYVWVYTPLKAKTPLNTAVGAVAGAMPVLIGWTAAGGSLNVWNDPRGVALFLVVFLWQFPHFMAIAWIYREQYARAGMFMMTVVDPSGRRAGVQAVLGALALLPVSLVPALSAPLDGGGVFLVAAFVSGLAMLLCSVDFLRARTDQTARRLLRVSLIYLPTVMLFLVLIPWM